MVQPDVPIKSTQRTFTILERVKEQDGASLSELADSLDAPASTIHNHLRTLEQMGYVTKKSDEYHLGLRFIHFGNQTKQKLTIYRYGKSAINELAEKTEEMGNLLVENRGRGIYVEVSRSGRSLQLDSYVQKLEYLHCTAVGKAILAHYDTERVEEIIDQHGMQRMTTETITDYDELLAELERVHEQGYALDKEERMKGLHCCAAPIVDNDGNPLGGISISGPKSRVNGEWFHDELPTMVMDTANEIEIQIIHS